jgi:calcineurin-like phosphoesterase family protein
MTKWFTADWHMGHANILEYCHRPFFEASVMDSAIIDRHNSVVGDDDDVFVLGDVTLLGLPAMREYIGAMNGNIAVVPGGHDWRWLRGYKEGVKPVSRSGYDLMVFPPLYTLELEEGERYPFVIVLCHYAMRVWDRSHYGSLHLYGHSHGMLPGIGRSMDVGVDTNNFYPYSLEEIKEKLCQNQQ